MKNNIKDKSGCVCSVSDDGKAEKVEGVEWDYLPKSQEFIYVIEYGGIIEGLLQDRIFMINIKEHRVDCEIEGNYRREDSSETRRERIMGALEAVTTEYMGVV